MLNLGLGTPHDDGGRSCLITTIGVSGHAIYGPYERIGAGHYIVQFDVGLVNEAGKGRDYLCAVLDVVSDVGRVVLARKDIYVSQLRGGAQSFALKFKVKAEAQVEYRVWINGRCSLMLGEYRPLIPIDRSGAAIQALLERHAFPGDEAEAIPFFRDHREHLRRLYEDGIGVRIFEGAVVLTAGGVSLYAKQADDLNFIGEVFHEKVYAFQTLGPVAVVDIGMNIGLSSLTFAKQGEVLEVHSFEPFATTYDRAIDNLELNPDIVDKIRAHNFGLSDRNAEESITVDQDWNSGAMSTVGAVTGVQIHVELKDAAETLGPIIAEARAKGRKVVMKVDCEGSEFAIFASLEASGLLPQISAFMVEWHALYPDRDQNTLIKPLKQAGFLVFDRSPRTGNGFFYAVRIAA